MSTYHLTEADIAAHQAVHGRKGAIAEAGVTVAARSPSKRVARQGERKRAAGKPAASEAEIQATILEWLRFKGIPHTITEAKRSFNEHGQLVRRIARGWPDVTGCYQGRMLALEVKSAIGKLRQDQAAVLHALWQAGALVVIARSLDDVISGFERGFHRPSEVEIAKALKRKL